MSDKDKVLALFESHGIQYTPSLNSRRDLCVTASDVPAICSENPFVGTNEGRDLAPLSRDSDYEIIAKKLFKIQKNAKVPEALAWGKKFEIVALKRFAEQTGAAIYFINFITHPQYKWFGGTVDALYIMPDGTGGVLEIKCPFKRSIRDEIPVYYYGQVQSYMEITGLSNCLFVQFKPMQGPQTKEQLLCTKILRDRAYMGCRMRILEIFWHKLTYYRYYKAVVTIQNLWLKKMGKPRRPYEKNKQGKEVYLSTKYTNNELCKII